MRPFYDAVPLTGIVLPASSGGLKMVRSGDHLKGGPRWEGRAFAIQGKSWICWPLMETYDCCCTLMLLLLKAKDLCADDTAVHLSAFLLSSASVTAFPGASSNGS